MMDILVYVSCGIDWTQILLSTREDFCYAPKNLGQNFDKYCPQYCNWLEIGRSRQIIEKRVNFAE